MKNKIFNKKNNEKISYFSAIILIISGFFALFIILYKSLFLISENNKINKNSYKKKLIIEHNYNWYKKQEKYLNNSKIIPVEFNSSLSKNDNNNFIKRHGMLLINKNAKATILVCHGFMSCKEDMLLLRTIFFDYNVLTFDFRAHGENSFGQSCTFGDDEKYDIIGAVNFIKTHPALINKPIFGYGFSMGAVSIIMALNEVSDLFSGIMLDCPFESTDNLMDRAFEKMKIDLFGFSISIPGGSLLKRYAYNTYIQDILKVLLKVFSRMDATKISTIIRKVSPKEAIHNINVPMILIGCHNDEKAPPSGLREIYNNAVSTTYKRLWISCGRKHFDSFFVNPEKYIYKLKSFVNLILNNDIKNKVSEKIKEDPCIYKIR